jgi:hypothetical protein
MSSENRFNDYFILRNIFRVLVLTLSLDEGGLSDNLKGYYRKRLKREQSIDEVQEMKNYCQEGLRRVQSVETWKVIFGFMRKKNVSLESTDFFCVFEVLCGVSMMGFGERILVLARWYYNIYGLRRNQVRKGNNGFISFDLDEPTGIRIGFEGCINRKFDEYSISWATDCLLRLQEFKFLQKLCFVEFFGFLYTRNIGPTFLLRKEQFYGKIGRLQGSEIYKLEIDRDNLLRGSYGRIMNVGEVSEFRSFWLRIEFKDEPGVDGGGLSKEWFSLLGEEIMKSKSTLFSGINEAREEGPIATGNTHDSGNCWKYFNRFVGRVMGLAILNEMQISLSLPFISYRFLLFDECNVRDLMDLDPLFCKNILLLRNEPDLKSLHLEFFSNKEVNGDVKRVYLGEDGRSIPITEDNDEEYIEKEVYFSVVHGRKKQMEELRRGFCEIVDISDLREFFTAEELKVLIEGSRTIDLDDWRIHSVFKGFNLNEETRYKEWFWNAVESLSEEQKAGLLKFVTGSSRVPAGGFSRLLGCGRNNPFTIKKRPMGANTNNLPIAHTCFNIIELPSYESYEKLWEKLVKIAEYSRGYGFI